MPAEPFERAASTNRALTVQRRKQVWREAMVPLLLDMRDLGLSNDEIADMMNRAGRKTLLGSRWTDSTVRRTLG